ncbi:MAG: hypothetical protein AAB074_01750 [Planctomycetota bacterium]
MPRLAALLAGMVFVAGCSSSEKEESAKPAKSSDRELAFAIGSKGFHLLVVASGGGTLRVVNTGDQPLSVCDDDQCFPLDAGGDMEMPVTGRCIIEFHSTGDGQGSAQVQLMGGGEGASVTERH